MSSGPTNGEYGGGLLKATIGSIVSSIFFIIWLSLLFSSTGFFGTMVLTTLPALQKTESLLTLFGLYMKLWSNLIYTRVLPFDPETGNIGLSFSTTAVKRRMMRLEVSLCRFTYLEID